MIVFFCKNCYPLIKIFVGDIQLTFRNVDQRVEFGKMFCQCFFKKTSR